MTATVVQFYNTSSVFATSSTPLPGCLLPLAELPKKTTITARGAKTERRGGFQTARAFEAIGPYDSDSIRAYKGVGLVSEHVKYKFSCVGGVCIFDE